MIKTKPFRSIDYIKTQQQLDAFSDAIAENARLEEGVRYRAEIERLKAELQFTSDELHRLRATLNG